MRGIKRKIPLEKIEKKESRAVAFSKRSKGLYSKASELCLLSGGQIAIIATPVSSNSNVSFHSFGHSSVDNVVAAFLANKLPPDDDLGLGFWWNDESLATSENPLELRQAIDSMSKMLQDLKDLRLDSEDVKKKKKGVLHGTHQKQTLDPRSSSTTTNCERSNKNSEEQIVGISDNNNSNNNSDLTGNLDGCNQELTLDQIFDYVKSQGPLVNLEMDDVSIVTKNQTPLSDPVGVESGGELVIRNKDCHDNNLHLSDLDENQIQSITDNNNNNGNEGNWFDEELDLDQILDFEAVEDRVSVMIQKDLDVDNLPFFQ